MKGTFGKNVIHTHKIRPVILNNARIGRNRNFAIRKCI